MRTASYYILSSIYYFGESHPVWELCPIFSPLQLCRCELTNKDILVQGLPLEGYPETDLDTVHRLRNKE
jgi:hypothetical protein